MSKSKFWKLETEQGNEIEIFRSKLEAHNFVANNYMVSPRPTVEQVEKFILDNGTTLTELDGIECPLCGEPIIPVTYGDTYIWSCPEACPFVGAEIVSQKDTDNLRDYLSELHG